MYAYGLINETPKQRQVKRLGDLRAIRARWDPHYRELAEHILPRRIRISLKDFERGERINDTIINNTPLVAARIAASGMMAAITSPSRVWFRQTTPDPEMAEFGRVRAYLHQVEERIRWAMAVSNFYQSLADGVYPDILVFGFSADYGEQHARRILNWTALPVGEAFLSANAEGQVDTVYRELPMTVRQLVNRFCKSADDLKNLSTSTRTAYERGQYDNVVEVVHAVEPNEEFDASRADRLGKRWSSTWFEKGCKQDDANRFLEESGYEEFPFLCPRWATRGLEVYARCPGMEILGDSKQLQHDEKRYAQLVDKSANPPTVADEKLRGSRSSLLAGDMTYAPSGTAETVRPIFEVREAAIRHVAEGIARVEHRIERGMFADLWMRVLQDERQQRATAREIEEGHQETMLQLGPVLERLNSELLGPAVDRFYYELERRGMLPPPPKELQGVELKTEFISVLHQAQKMVSLAGIRTLVQETAFLVQSGWENARDKLNPDQVVDEIAAMTGVKPEMVLSDEEVAKVRDARAKREQAMQAGQAALAAAKAGKDLGTTPAPAPDNMLGAIAQQLPAAAAAGVIPNMTTGIA
jgi:hypothetical protein